MEQKVIQIGNSAGLIIPKALLKQAKIKRGEKLILEAVSNRRAILIRRKEKKYENISSLTFDFFVMLDDFNKKHGDTLRELAKR